METYEITYGYQRMHEILSSLEEHQLIFIKLLITDCSLNIPIQGLKEFGVAFSFGSFMKNQIICLIFREKKII